MRSNRKIARGLLAGLLLIPATAPLAADNPYADIVTRNSFSLLPPDPPPKAEEDKPPANIKLTGITTMLGDKRALLMVQETVPGAKPEQSVVLREGQREDDIEVLEIDEKAGAVKIRNAGIVSTLTFDRDGLKPVAAPVPATAPTIQPPGGAPKIATRDGNPGPTAFSTALGQPRPTGALRHIPTRTLRLPPAP